MNLNIFINKEGGLYIINNVINKISENIVERTKNSFEFKDINQKLNSFLNSKLESALKVECIEQLYFLVLYKDAYVSPDPRYKAKLIFKALNILNVEDESVFYKELKALKEVVNVFKEAECNPLATFEKKINDSIKYSDTIF